MAIIELSQMSFSYVRFFSPSQVLADGLLILVLLIFFVSTFFFLYLIHCRYINPVSTDNTPDYEKPLEIESKTSYIQCFSLFLLYIILLILEIYVLSNILKKLDYLFYILTVFSVATIILYLALAAWMFANLSIINTWFHKNIFRHTIWLSFKHMERDKCLKFNLGQIKETYGMDVIGYEVQSYFVTEEDMLTPYLREIDLPLFLSSYIIQKEGYEALSKNYIPSIHNRFS